MHQCIVLYFHNIFFKIETKVDFLWFATTNLFVAFPMNFLADQNVMGCVGVDLTFDLSDETLT